MSAKFADIPRPDSASRAAALAAPPGGQCLVLLAIEELVAPADPKRRFAPIIATADPARKTMTIENRNSTCEEDIEVL